MDSEAAKMFASTDPIIMKGDLKKFYENELSAYLTA